MEEIWRVAAAKACNARVHANWGSDEDNFLRVCGEQFGLFAHLQDRLAGTKNKMLRARDLGPETQANMVGSH